MGNRSAGRISAIRLGAAGGAVLLALTSTAAVAQDDSGALQEIVVWAQRVQGTLQDTPISLAAFDADALRAIGAVAAGDAAAYTPNVQIDRTPLSRTAYSVSIRGIRSADPSLALDPTVGVYLDGVTSAGKAVRPSRSSISSASRYSGGRRVRSMDATAPEAPSISLPASLPASSAFCSS